MTKDEMKLLFHRFSQGNPRTYKTYGGSGLGLFISKELTELQGGQIGVSSTELQGSTFTFFVKARRIQDTGSMEMTSNTKRKRMSDGGSIAQSMGTMEGMDTNRSQGTAEPLHVLVVGMCP